MRPAGPCSTITPATRAAHIAPAVGEPSVEVPIDDLVAFVAHVVTERRIREMREVVNSGELLERDEKRGRK